MNMGEVLKASKLVAVVNSDEFPLKDDVLNSKFIDLCRKEFPKCIKYLKCLNTSEGKQLCELFSKALNEVK